MQYFLTRNTSFELELKRKLFKNGFTIHHVSIKIFRTKYQEQILYVREGHH